MGVLFEDAFAQPPTAEVADAYNDPGQIFEFVADTEQDFNELFLGSLATPRILLVDTRDMRIHWKFEGRDTDLFLAEIEELLALPP